MRPEEEMSFQGDVSKEEFPLEEVIDCNNKAG